MAALFRATDVGFRLSVHCLGFGVSGFGRPHSGMM